ncbi:hypothetical protein JYU34_006704 [Plutella xylostella]|uniref:SCP domain-containing protein n=1 Tax=Plutella xylostella TaxID=51655 RepID=A0ABQ7QSQ8_PLUXY|nr:hypothetical protein JYU34_006704 [Plutella xylostella]
MWYRIIVFISVLSVQGAINYCGKDICNNSKQHTLCKYQLEHPAANCINYKRLINKNDKVAVLHKINARRNKIAAGEIRSLPSAANMMKLVWSEELAVSAQRWADQCTGAPGGTDTCRDLATSPVGQSVATIFGDAPGLTAVALVDVWFTQLLNVNATIVDKYLPSPELSSPYDDFTQLAWAASREVGCGAVRFTQVSGGLKNVTVHRLVCNFAPAGNHRGESVYKDGVPCTQCPGGSQCDDEYLALCPNLKMTVPVNETIDEEIISKKDLMNENTTELATHTVNYTAAPDNDDVLPMFNYFAHTNTLSRQPVTIRTTAKENSCKEAAVDELLEILKKKLTTDPMFKDIFSLIKSLEVAESNFSDEGVVAFVNRLYRKNNTPTVTAKREDNSINSTLLTELVEAVIFRNADKHNNEYAATTSITADLLPISPIRIQAEVAPVKTNEGFTGHYFFPEDITEHGTDETSEYYNENTEPPVTDVILEIENFKKQSATRDFVDEILDLETASDSPISTKHQFILSDIRSNKGTTFKSGQHNIRKFLEDINEKSDKIEPYKYDNSHILDENKGLRLQDNVAQRRRREHARPFIIGSTHERLKFEHTRQYPKRRMSSAVPSYVIQYKELLKQLAADIKTFHFKEKKHCSSRACAGNNIDTTFLIIVISFLFI